MVPVDGMGTLSVGAVKAQPVLGIQKALHQVGKWFRDRFVAVPEKRKVKKPVGLKTRPAWLWQDYLGTSMAGCQAWHPLPCRP